MVRHHNATRRKRHHKTSRLEREVRTVNVRALQQAADDLGVTKKEIAEWAGRAPRTVRRWFSGQTKFGVEDLAHMPTKLLRHYVACLQKGVHQWLRTRRVDG